MLSLNVTILYQRYLQIDKKYEGIKSDALKKIDLFWATQHFNNLCCLFLFGASKDKEFYEYSLTFDLFIYLESLFCKNTRKLKK